MCIFAGPVRSVSGTSIFVSRLHDRQCVVYAMRVALRGGQGNAMILPVPAPAASIELVDLSAVPDFFAPLEEMFVERTRSMTKGMLSASIQVQRVGSYDVSVVPSAKDIARLNPDVFDVSPETGKALHLHYEGYAFVVAQLRQSGEFHPLAYTHRCREEGVFVPTRHGHGGSLPPQWDHNIYYQTGSPDFGEGGVRSANAAISARPLAALSTKLLVDPSATRLVPYLRHASTVHRLRVQGPAKNVDIRIE